MFKLKDYLIIGFICLALGWVAVRQFDLRLLIKELSEPAKNESLALEASSLIENNDKLEARIVELNQSHSKLTETANDRVLAEEQISTDLELYRIVAGATIVRGPGLEINIGNKMEKPQMIDLLNAIRNIGAEAISFNKQRVIYNFSFDGTSLAPPYEIRIIGDKGLIKDSLQRRGGILEQISAKADIQEREDIVIPAAE